MTSTARPSTPYPHTHTLQHTATGAIFHAMPAQSYFAMPIHFTPRELPTRTPPSLLNRSGSSSSTCSRSSYRRQPSSPALPSLDHSRRESSTSVISEEADSPVLITPAMDFISLPSSPSTVAFELPEPLVQKRGFALPPPEYNWTDKEITSETSFNGPQLSKDMLLSPPSPRITAQSSPVRPSLTRRDTPRPTTESLTTYSMSVSSGAPREERYIGRRRLTSMVDGGDWIIIE